MKSPGNFLADAVGNDNVLYSFLSIIADRLPRMWEAWFLDNRAGIILVLPVAGELLCHARVRAGNCQRINGMVAVVGTVFLAGVSQNVVQAPQSA